LEADVKGWKTIATNAVALVFALLVYFGIELPEPKPEYVAGFLAIVNIVLRLVTTTPVGRKE
jgi:hypothetical protein